MLNFNNRELVQIMSNGRKFDRIIIGIFSLAALAGVVGVTVSIGTIHSFAQTDLTTTTTTGSTQDQGGYN